MHFFTFIPAAAKCLYDSGTVGNRARENDNTIIRWWLFTRDLLQVKTSSCSQPLTNRAFIEPNRFGIIFGRRTQHFAWSRPEGTTQTHGARFTTRTHNVFLSTLGGMQRKRLQLFLGKLNGGHFSMDGRVGQGYDPVSPDREQLGLVSLGVFFKNGTAKGSPASFFYIAGTDFDGHFHHGFVRLVFDIFQTRFVGVQPVGEIDGDSVEVNEQSVSGYVVDVIDVLSVAVWCTQAWHAKFATEFGASPHSLFGRHRFVVEVRNDRDGGHGTRGKQGSR